MADSTAMTERTTEPKHFRLRDLPGELQIKIYQKYFEGSRLTLKGHHHASGKLKFYGIPSLNLEMVCHDMHIEARKARSQKTGDILVVWDVHILNNGDFTKFVDDPMYSWVRSHIQKLDFRGTHLPLSGGVDWKPVIARCARLQEFDVWITVTTVVMPFRIADAQCTGFFPPAPSKDVAQDVMRNLLATDRIAIQAIGSFSPVLLRKLLAQRSARYKVTFDHGVIYSDLEGRRLLTDVSLCEPRGQRVFADRVSSQLTDALIDSKAPSMKRMLQFCDPTVESWFNELDWAGEAEAFRKRGGIIIG